MQLTAYSDYALRVLMYLAHLARDEERLASIDEIARAYEISRNHVMKVVHHLASAGYVETVRGRGGGMRLAVSAHAIHVGAVCRTTESFALAPCSLPGRQRCVIAASCTLRHVLDEALARFFEALDTWTIADLVAQPAPLPDLLGIGRTSGARRGAHPRPTTPAAKTKSTAQATARARTKRTTSTSKKKSA